MHLGSRRTVLPLEGSTASPVSAPWCLGGFLGGHVQDAPTFRRSPRGKHRGHDSWLAARTRGPRTPGLPWQCPPIPGPPGPLLCGRGRGRARVAEREGAGSPGDLWISAASRPGFSSL